MKICSVLGNRPHFIKHGLLSKRLRQEHEEVIIHTGQHYDQDMSVQFFAEMALPEVDYYLGCSNTTPLSQLGCMLPALESVLKHCSPDLVLVHGDTSTSLAGALAASKLHIPIAHVEAGVRCGDRSVPEEVNRVLVDQMSEFLFCPSRQCVSNLDEERVPPSSYFAGDVLYDTYLHYSKLALTAVPTEYIFVTIHREANTDNKDNLCQILMAMSELDKKYGVVFPMHPRTRNKLGLDRESPEPAPPMGYLDTLAHIKGASLVITDSGGVQREAYFSVVPCIYIGTAGWKELDWSYEVSADAEEIVQTAEMLLDKGRKKVVFWEKGILGDGNAVEKIAEVLRDYNSQ